jgi:hypothetical protein
MPHIILDAYDYIIIDFEDINQVFIIVIVIFVDGDGEYIRK